MAKRGHKLQNSLRNRNARKRKALHQYRLNVGNWISSTTKSDKAPATLSMGSIDSNKKKTRLQSSAQKTPKIGQPLDTNNKLVVNIESLSIGHPNSSPLSTSSSFQVFFIIIRQNKNRPQFKKSTQDSGIHSPMELENLVTNGAWQGDSTMMTENAKKGVIEVLLIIEKQKL